MVVGLDRVQLAAEWHVGLDERLWSGQGQMRSLLVDGITYIHSDPRSTCSLADEGDVGSLANRTPPSVSADEVFASQKEVNIQRISTTR